MSTRKSETIAKRDVPDKPAFGFNSVKGEPFQIKSVKVDVNIIGHVAEVTSCLTYCNEGKTPVSSVFTLPEVENGTVYQLEADIGGQHIVTSVQRKPEAHLTKEDAFNHGTAAMIYKRDKSSEGVSCMLGDVPAKSEASLVLKYVTELPQEPDGQLRFTLPTVLNPRYSSDKGDKKAVKNDKNVAPSKVPYKFSMTATVKAYHKVTSVTSETVKLNVTFEEDNKIAKVLIGDDFKFDRDIQLCVLYEKPYSPQVILGNQNPKSEEVCKKDICMLSFQPDLRKISIATNGEYVFIIEMSGKMDRTKMGNAKKALQLFLRSLPADCFFNVICYAAKVNSLFRNSNKYTEKTLKEAFIFLEKMKTDITNNADIFKALHHIYGKKPISGHPRK
ncbi:von Willebrand factor A domain-containing protein 5A-like, partial [Ruditapes philippinarum]|uniref:von Willebrand factor A domain-containing protein 5A-like n=1 Tax=Ruditapes philippinarum TaxID=129788 RepID=UPI00295AE8FB